MSTAPVQPTAPVEAPKESKSLRKILLGVVLVPLIAFIALAANAVRLEQQTEETRRRIGAAEGRTTTERRVPGWLRPIAGENAHSFLDQTVIVGVTMMGESVGDEQVAKVTNVPDLKWLNLAESLVTSTGLASVAKLTSLESLDLTNSRVSDISELTKLPKLTELRLDYSRNVEAEHLKAVAKMPALRSFGANGLRLTDEGIAIISEATQLEDLGIMGARLNQGGLAPLQKLKNLQQLKLTHAIYHPEDLAAFREAVPGCKIAE
jgi:hypothetical protein